MYTIKSERFYLTEKLPEVYGKAMGKTQPLY